MNLVSLATHTVDMDALPDEPCVLDVGCRNFDFTGELLKYRPHAVVAAMDPDPTMSTEGMQDGVRFVREALVGDDRAESLYAAHSTGEGNFLCAAVPHYAVAHTVPCVTIGKLMERLGVAYWDLIKLDCEEAEFLILENWPGRIAGQLSIEFHDWTNRKKWDDAYYARLFAGPLKDYDVLRHETTTVGPGPAWGHWDSVLRIKQ